MDDVMEFTAIISKEGNRYRATCPEIGVSLTSSNYPEALYFIRKWTRALVDPVMLKDTTNT